MTTRRPAMVRAALAALSLAAAALPGAAAAQSNGFGASAQVKESFSFAGLERLLQQNGIVTRRESAPDGSSLLLGTSSGGGTFLVVPRDCTDSVTLSGCPQVELGILFNYGSPTLEQINRWHAEGSFGSTAVKLGEVTALGRKVVALGGVTDKHFMTQVGIFFMDADSIQKGVLRSGQSLVSLQDDRARMAGLSFPSLMGEAPAAPETPAPMTVSLGAQGGAAGGLGGPAPVTIPPALQVLLDGGYADRPATYETGSLTALSGSFSR